MIPGRLSPAAQSQSVLRSLISTSFESLEPSQIPSLNSASREIRSYSHSTLVRLIQDIDPNISWEILDTAEVILKDHHISIPLHLAKIGKLV